VKTPAVEAVQPFSVVVWITPTFAHSSPETKESWISKTKRAIVPIVMSQKWARASAPW